MADCPFQVGDEVDHHDSLLFGVKPWIVTDVKREGGWIWDDNPGGWRIQINHRDSYWFPRCFTLVKRQGPW